MENNIHVTGLTEVEQSSDTFFAANFLVGIHSDVIRVLIILHIIDLAFSGDYKEKVSQRVGIINVVMQSYQ